MRRAALALVLLGACNKSTPPEPKADTKPAAAPTAPAAPALPATVDGPELLKLVRAHKGKPVLVNVLASWCTPCRAELPAIAQLQKDHPQLVLIGVDVDEDTEALKKFLPQIPSTMLLRRSPAGASPLFDALQLPADWHDAATQMSKAMGSGDWRKTVPTTLVWNDKGEFETGSVGQLQPEAIAAIAEVAKGSAAAPSPTGK